MNKVRAMNEFEFCEAVNCNRLVRSDTHADQFQCLAYTNNLCIRTMKQFVRWANDNGFMIVKEIEE